MWIKQIIIYCCVYRLYNNSDPARDLRDRFTGIFHDVPCIGDRQVSTRTRNEYLQLGNTNFMRGSNKVYEFVLVKNYLSLYNLPFELDPLGTNRYSY